MNRSGIIAIAYLAFFISPNTVSPDNSSRIELAFDIASISTFFNGSVVFSDNPSAKGQILHRGTIHRTRE